MAIEKKRAFDDIPNAPSRLALIMMLPGTKRIMNRLFSMVYFKNLIKGWIAILRITTEINTRKAALKEKELQGCQQIQRVMRGCNARRRVKKIKFEMYNKLMTLRNLSAGKIQTSYRCFRSRCVLNAVREARLKELRRQKAILIQKIFRGYYYRIDSKERERNALISEVRVWGNGKLQNLFERPEMQTIEAQGLLIAVKRIMTTPVRPAYLLQPVRVVRKYREGVKAMRLKNDLQLSTFKKDYTCIYQERKAMQGEDLYARLKERYEITMRAHREAIETERRAKLERARLETERRRRRKQLMGAVYAIQNEAALEKWQRELMLLQDIMSMRIEVHERHIYNKSIKQNLEIMKQEDILAHSCRRSQKDNSIMNMILEAEMKKVRDAKHMGEKRIGLGGKKWKRGLAERNCWNKTQNDKASTESEYIFMESFRKPFLLRAKAENDGSGNDALRDAYEGDTADRNRALEVLLNRVKPMHKVSRIDNIRPSITKVEEPTIGKSKTTTTTTTVTSGGEVLLDELFGGNSSKSKSVILKTAESSASNVGNLFDDLFSDAFSNPTYNSVPVSSNDTTSLLRIKFKHEPIGNFSVKLLFLMRFRSLQSKTTILSRTYYENICKFKMKHIQLTTMRHQLIKNKIKTRRERKVIQDVANFLESQLVALHSEIVGNFNIYTSLIRELVSIFFELFGLDIYSELSLENAVLAQVHENETKPMTSVGTSKKEKKVPSYMTDAKSKRKGSIIEMNKDGKVDNRKGSISMNSNSNTPNLGAQKSNKSGSEDDFLDDLLGGSVKDRGSSSSYSFASASTTAIKYLVPNFDNFWNIDENRCYFIPLMSQLPEAPPVVKASYEILNYSRKVVYTSPASSGDPGPYKESKDGATAGTSAAGCGSRLSPTRTRAQMLARSSSSSLSPSLSGSSSPPPLRGSGKKSPSPARKNASPAKKKGVNDDDDDEEDDDSVLVIPAFHYFLDEDLEKYSFLSDGILNIRWYEQKVAKWLVAIADIWKEIHFPYCLSCVNRILWLSSNGKMDEINADDPVTVSSLRQAGISDLYELLISQVALRFDCWDAYFDRSGLKSIPPPTCEFFFGNHPFSILNRLFSFKALRDYSLHEKDNGYTPDNKLSDLYSIFSNLLDLHKIENRMRIKLIDNYISIDGLLQQFHVHSKLFEQLIFNKSSLRSIVGMEMRCLADISDAIVDKRLLVIYNDIESRSTGIMKIGIKCDVSPHQFTEVIISESDWQVKFPSWMLPMARVGLPAGSEPFWRRLQKELDAGITGGKYARMHRKDIVANNISRQFMVNLKMKLLTADAYRSKVVDDELLKNNRELMIYEDVRSKASDIYEKKLFIAHNPSIMRTIKRMLAISNDADLRVLSADEKNMLKRGCSKPLNQKRLRASINIKHDFNPTGVYNNHDSEKSLLAAKYDSVTQLTHWVTGEKILKRDVFFDKAMAQLRASFAYSSLPGSFTEELWVAGGIFNAVSVFRVVENGQLNPRGLPLCEDIRCFSGTDNNGGNRGKSLAYFGSEAAESDMRRNVINARNAFLTSRILCHNMSHHFASFSTKRNRHLCESCLRSIIVEDVKSTLPNLKESLSDFWNFSIHSPGLGRYSRSENLQAVVKIQTRYRMIKAKKFVNAVGEARMMNIALHENNQNIGDNKNDKKYDNDSQSRSRSQSQCEDVGETERSPHAKVVKFNLNDLGLDF